MTDHTTSTKEEASETAADHPTSLWSMDRCWEQMRQSKREVWSQQELAGCCGPMWGAARRNCDQK